MAEVKKYRATRFSGSDSARDNPFVKINPLTGETDLDSDKSFRYKPGDRDERRNRATLLANLGLVAQGAIYAGFENGHKRGGVKLKKLFGLIGQQVINEAWERMEKEYPNSRKSVKAWVAEDAYLCVAGLDSDSKRNDKSVEDLLKTVDWFFGTDLFTRCQYLVSESAGSLIYVRFLIDVALSLADLASRPFTVSPDSQFIPNLVYMGTDNKPVTQIDGIVIPKQYMADQAKPSLDSVMSQGIPYSLLEFKSLFRTNHTLNSKTVRHPRREDVRYVKEQLALIGLERIEKGYSDFRLPEQLVFSYLRGPQGRTTFRVVVDEEFIQSWIDGLEKHNFKDGISGEVRKKTAILIILLYEEKKRIEEARLEEMREFADKIKQGVFAPALVCVEAIDISISTVDVPRSKKIKSKYRKVRFPGLELGRPSSS